jgi:hypothetical protein
MNALIFLKKQFRKMGQFRAIRDFFDTLLAASQELGPHEESRFGKEIMLDWAQGDGRDTHLRPYVISYTSNPTAE